MSRTTPWGANVARAASGDPYVSLESIGAVKGESCAQALVKAGLDWTVGLKSISVTGGRKIDRYKAVVRQSDNFALGVVGRAYTPIQNVELATFADNLADEAGSTTSAVGLADEGRRVYAVVEMGEWRPPGMGGGEVVNLSTIVSSRHDGGGSLTAGLFPLRLSCANGMRALIRTAARSVKIRHTVGADVRLDEVRRALGMGEKAIDAFAAAAERLIDTAMTDAKFNKLMEQLMPVGEPDVMAQSTATRRTNARDAMFALWSESDNLADVRGTAYAAVNAVAEWEQWERPLRGRTDRNEAQMLALTGGGRTLADTAAAILLG